MKPMSRARKGLVIAASVVLATAIGATLVAVGSIPRPRDMHPPAVEWREDSQWAGNPWVEAVRRSEALLSYALANGDYSDPDLVAAVGYADAMLNATGLWTLPDFDFTRIAHYSRVMSVDVAPNGHVAYITMCVNGGSPELPAWAQGVSWWVRQLEDGTYQAAPRLTYGHTYGGAEGHECYSTLTRPAYWAEPVSGSDFTMTPREPVSADAYEHLGADDYVLPAGYERGTLPTAAELSWFDGNTTVRGVHPLFDEYLESYIALSWAAAHNDFSMPEVVGALGYQGATQGAQEHQELAEEDLAPYYPRGRAELAQNPVAIALVSVEEVSDTRIIASICRAFPYEFRDIAHDALVVVTITRPAVGPLTWTDSFVTRDRWRDEHTAEEPYPCSTATRTFAVWPEPIDTFASHKVDTVHPRERSYYVELGVIDG